MQALRGQRLIALLWGCALCLEPCLQGRIFSTNGYSMKEGRRDNQMKDGKEKMEESWESIMRMFSKKLFNNLGSSPGLLEHQHQREITHYLVIRIRILWIIWKQFFKLKNFNTHKVSRFKRSDLNKTGSNKQELSWAMFFPNENHMRKTMMSEMPALANPE